MPLPARVKTQYDAYHDYFENQVHGGNIVAQNISFFFWAISTDHTGDNQLRNVLRSLPEEELEKITPDIYKIYMDFDLKFKELSQKKKRAVLGSRKRELLEEEKKLKQDLNTRICQKAISYLNRIGQWWLRPNKDIDLGVYSLYEEEGMAKP